MTTLDAIMSIIVGLCVCVPVVIKLGQTINTAIAEKNWAAILELVMDFMTKAETMFVNGTDRKAWVMTMTKSAAQRVNYNYDLDTEKKVSELVDSICDLSKKINKEG